MTLPMIVLPRPAPSPERATATQGTHGRTHDGPPATADGATGFAELLGAAVLAESPTGSADDAPADPGGEATVGLTTAVHDPTPTEQAEQAEQTERADREEPAGDLSVAALQPTGEVPTDTVAALAVAATAAHQVAIATDTTSDHATGDHLGNDDDLPLPGPLAVRPRSGASVPSPSTPAPAIDHDAAIDNTEPWAFAVTDHPTGASDRPTGPTLTLPEVTTAPTGSAAGATPDSFPTQASAAAPGGSPTAVVDVTAIAEAVDLADTTLRELRRGELQRIGASRLGMDVATTSLGSIRIEALERGGELQLRLGADQSAARALLSERLPELREHLRAEGVDIGSVEISYGHDRTRGDRDRQAEPPNLTHVPDDTEPASGHSPTDTAVRALAASVMSAAGRVDVRI